MSDKSTSARRNFLLGTGAVSVAAVATLATVKKTESTVKTSKAGVPAGKGYQLSEHVRNYYRTTTI